MPLDRSSRILITAGDPCGIGPEVTLRALGGLPRRSLRNIVVIGDADVFERTARKLGLSVPAWRMQRAAVARDPKPDVLGFLDCGHSDAFRPGESGEHAGRAALDYLEAAIGLLKRGRAAGLVTAPLTKRSVERVCPDFTGHTEYLARAFKTRCVVMLFASDKMRVVPLTRHIPLREVGRRADSRLVESTLVMTADALRGMFGVREPKLALLGLNPHAGEDGLFGDEEQRVLKPVLRRLRSRGLRCEGPLAADGYFAQPVRADAVIGCYHDQVLIPFKMVSRDSGCQVTLGLPFVRTSPDHGSALDIAGSGRANPGAMRYAIGMAERLVALRLRSRRAAKASRG